MYNVGIRGDDMFKKLAQKLVQEREKRTSAAMNPIEVDFEQRQSVFLKHLTKTAVNMYERKADIKKFTKLALSDPENTSHNKLVAALFSHGIINAEDEEKLLKLSDNGRFLKDLGLTE